MKLVFLPFLLLGFTFPLQAADDCEQRYQQLVAKYELDQQSARKQHEAMQAKTTHWFVEAKRSNKSVKTLYRLRAKQKEALQLLDQKLAQRLSKLEQQHRFALKHWEASCRKSREKIKVDILIEAPTETRPARTPPTQEKVVPRTRTERKEEGKEATVKKRKRARGKAGRNLLSEAQKHLNAPYRYGGNHPREGFDCSGFVKYVYAKQGISLPRVSRDQAKAGEKVKRKEVKEGDLVYFGPRKGKTNHIGIVTSASRGKLKMIHASRSKGIEIVAVEGNPYWEKRTQGFRRVMD
jgi:cell wall-associated NlpC family hydrolase